VGPAYHSLREWTTHRSTAARGSGQSRRRQHDRHNRTSPLIPYREPDRRDRPAAGWQAGEGGERPFSACAATAD